MKYFITLSIALCLLSLPALADTQTPRPSLNESDIPEALKPWSQWVLSDYHGNHCPFLYNNASQKYCIWPGELNLKLDNNGAEFQLKANVYDEGWLTLPGTQSRWPQHVKSGGQNLIVSDREGHPTVFLQSGNYTITGSFSWNEMPESLPLPQSLALLHLEVDGKTVRFPSIDETNILWVKRQETLSTEAERIDVKIFRRITDSIPTRITTRLMLHVSGKPREVLLSSTMLKNFTPINVESPIPARIEPDGSLRLQVRPGTWQLDIESRGTSAINEFELPTPSKEASSKLMPREEIWVFEAMNYLRIVQVEGANTIDPTQTELPQEWRNLPAYYMQTGNTFKLAEKKRGNSEPSPDELSMSKELWLDFDGNGYTVRDKINGNISQSWRLEVQPNIELGRAAISGHDQFITRLSPDKAAGIEIRPGNLSLDADSRIENAKSEFYATGWAHDMRSLSANLHLPAGWSLFYANGADYVSDSWVQRWTLLDVFMLVIVVVSIHRLEGLRTALITAPGFILLHHALSDMTSISLMILAAIALLRVLPEGRFAKAITFTRRMCILLLLFIALPFMITHMRLALFPQLGMYESYASNTSGNINTLNNVSAKHLRANKAAMTEEVNMMASAPPPPPPSPTASEMDVSSSIVSDMATPSISNEQKIRGNDEYNNQQEIYQYDPSMQSNTGFGIANWQGRIIHLNWSGPVLASQSLHLWLMSPTINLLLAIIRILLLFYIMLVLMGVHIAKDSFKNLPHNAIKAFAVALALWISTPQSARAESDDIPPAPILEELKRKLITAQEKPPTCLPQCANLPHAIIEANNDQLSITLEVHANEDTVIPLPGPINSWRPTDITVDQGALTPSIKSENDNYLHLAISRGVHIIRLTGLLPTIQESVNLSFPLKPALMQATATGWEVQGLQPDGTYNGSLQLIFTGARNKAQETTLEKNHFAGLIQIERTLNFGLSWQVETTIRRLSPVGESIAVQIPLLPGETVTSADLPVKDGKAYVSINPNGTERSWTSQLPASKTLTLTAPKNTDWPESVSGNEFWRLNISNLWHVSFEGIPSINMPQTSQTMYTNSGQPVQMPSFSPLPGESLTLHITRPEGVIGQTLTIDHSQLTVNAGTSALEATLELTLRASQGGQHTITLPENAIISSAMLNGSPTSLSTKEGNVTLPLSPGSQTYTITWNQPTSMNMSYSLPAVNLHIPSVNAESTLKLPRDRWLLITHGPQMGPAILFWGWIPVILLAAFALGQISLTPLRFHHWLLLLLGLTQTGLMTNLIIVGWLLALGIRAKETTLKPTAFNIQQLVLGFWTLISLSTLFNGIRIGLLGSPNMRIQGNQSSSYMLKWYQDIASELLPQPSIFSLPIFCYRTLMLLWALWLAFALLKWLQWGWKCYSSGGYWQGVSFWRKK